MLKKLRDTFKQRHDILLTKKTKEYYKGLNNKDLVELIIAFPNTSENLSKFCLDLLIQREKNQDLEFEIAKGLEMCYQTKSDKIKVFEYLVKEKNILRSSIYQYAKEFMVKRYFDYYLNGSHWNSKNQILKSSILTELEIQQCAKIAMSDYKKHVEDSLRNIEMYT
ncbi:hypothetical protein K1F50_14580 [Muricauda oceani]|uniref:Uncharacterized protein n=1 Tax=Flagellimonas oceani TaxID=2698672 RepID=A0A6G7J314_9FLAO|nr:hypothetical protein [Allomuricauda oceani]MBW8244031.1 hypothetical protein [Allomuricauda oceani]QII45008.1 hypothetical protein GVT53_10045 [Allomuricauda oceani]